MSGKSRDARKLRRMQRQAIRTGGQYPLTLTAPASRPAPPKPPKEEKR